MTSGRCTSRPSHSTRRPTAFSKAIELDRGNGWAYGNLALAYMQQGKYKQTVSLLLRSIELLDGTADKAVSWNRLASAYRLLNDYDNAVAAYQMADQLASLDETGTEEQTVEPSTGVPAGSPVVNMSAKVGVNLEAAAEAPAAATPSAATAQASPVEETSNAQKPADAPSWIFIPMSDTAILEPEHAAETAAQGAEVEVEAVGETSASQASAPEGSEPEGCPRLRLKET